VDDYKLQQLYPLIHLNGKAQLQRLIEILTLSWDKHKYLTVSTFSRESQTFLIKKDKNIFD
jgi:hypothetical protein